MLLLLILSKVYYRDQFAAKPYECAAAAATDAVSTLSRSRVYCCCYSVVDAAADLSKGLFSRSDCRMNVLLIQVDTAGWRMNVLLLLLRGLVSQSRVRRVR